MLTINGLEKLCSIGEEMEKLALCVF